MTIERENKFCDLLLDIGDKILTTSHRIQMVNLTANFIYGKL